MEGDTISSVKTRFSSLAYQTVLMWPNTLLVVRNSNGLLDRVYSFILIVWHWNWMAIYYCWNSLEQSRTQSVNDLNFSDQVQGIPFKNSCDVVIALIDFETPLCCMWYIFYFCYCTVVVQNGMQWLQGLYHNESIDFQNCLCNSCLVQS